MWKEKEILKSKISGLFASIERDNVDRNLTYHLEADLIREFNRWYLSGRGDYEQLEKIIRSAILVWLKYIDRNGVGKSYEYYIFESNGEVNLGSD